MFSFLSFFILAPAGHTTIRYEISVAHPEKHIFHVTMDIPDVSHEVIVQLPAWNALYQIRDFSSHVRQVAASTENKILPIEKVDKQTWKVSGQGTVKIEYFAYWDEPGPFGTQLNSEHAFINPAMILFYVPARRNEAVTLAIVDALPGWKAASAASSSSLSDAGDGGRFSFAAPSYDQLTDDPMEIAHFDEFLLPGLSPPVRVVVHGDNWKKSTVEDELTRICQYEIKLMGDAPYHEYIFIFHIGHGATGGGGGMEHASSTAIYVSSAENLPGVSAHEFFHLWNVKRIRPASLEPVDYSKEQYSPSLWFSEGVTSTYGSYTLMRTGIFQKQEFYDDLSQQITELEIRPAEKWQSVEESSIDAWLEKYNLYNSPESSISYYTKGQVLGVLLDLTIRERTANARSLDDVLRAMNVEFAQKGKFYRDSTDIRLTAERMCGCSLQDFFQKYVSGTERLPYEMVLAGAGLEMHKTDIKRTSLGFVIGRDSNGMYTIQSVDDQNAAAIEKLKPGDEILNWNGEAIPRRTNQWAAKRKAGEILKLRIRRDGKEFTVDVPLTEMMETYYQVAEISHADSAAERIRDGWLRGFTSPAAKQN
jgi:predicted metalloprotease with PDZ domain